MAGPAHKLGATGGRQTRRRSALRSPKLAEALFPEPRQGGESGPKDRKPRTEGHGEPRRHRRAGGFAVLLALATPQQVGFYFRSREAGLGGDEAW